MPESWRPNEHIAVWPRPLSVSSGKMAATVPVSSVDSLFSLRGGCCKELLQPAFARYHRNILWVTEGEAPLPNLRVRVPDVRTSHLPREQRHCDSGGTTGMLPAFGGLQVDILANTPTDLQLGADESYELTLDPQGGVLRAPTEWGALRGLETFAQLVHWSGVENRLCNLPVKISDVPQYSWRGLLLDSSRHFLPLQSGMLPILEGMEALKLNVLHWHLTDGVSFPYGSEALPQLPARGAFHPSLVYSIADMRLVVREAWLRGIRVVPEIDMPAHTASWGHGAPAVLVSCPGRVAEDEEGLEHGINKPGSLLLTTTVSRCYYEVVTSLLSIYYS